MKRSMAVSLVLLGSTAVGLSACKPKTENYSNVEACKASGKHSEKECRDAYDQALREHQESSPRFSSREACNQVAGASGCEERHLVGDAIVFVPMMLGFALEQGRGYRPLYQYPGSRDCFFTRQGATYGNCPGGGGNGGGFHGGWWHGGGGSSDGGSSGGDDGGSARGGFGEAGHAAAGHGGGGGGGE